MVQIRLGSQNIDQVVLGKCRYTESALGANRQNRRCTLVGKKIRSRLAANAFLAQQVELLICNQWVVGSIPAEGSKK